MSLTSWMVSRSPDTTSTRYPRGPACRERGEDVVGLVVLFLERADVHRRQRLLQQRDLSLELDRRLTASALVLRVLPRAQGLPRHVERDDEVGRLLVGEQQQQHREEPVDRVRVLTVAGRGNCHGKGVERPKASEWPSITRRVLAYLRSGTRQDYKPADTGPDASSQPRSAMQHRTRRERRCRDESCARRGIRVLTAGMSTRTSGPTVTSSERTAR